MNSRCDICEVELNKENSPFGWRRCKEHWRCDVCGSKDNTCCSHGKNVLLCDVCHKKRTEQKVAGFLDDTSYTNEVVCPWCGYAYSDSWEWTEGETKCENCEHTFDMSRNMSFTYTTERVKEQI